MENATHFECEALKPLGLISSLSSLT